MDQKPTKKAGLPEFKNPPVTEVVLGVEFDPLMNFKSAHAGRYWGTVAERYPNTEQQPPLLSSIERFGDAFWEAQKVRLAMLDPEAVRHWLISADNAFLIQLQRDRFISNWRKISAETEYPRYEGTLRERFVDEYTRFAKFLREGNLGEPTIRQCEVTYVNDVPREAGWTNFEQALDLTASWKCRGTDGFLGAPSTLSVGAAYDMPEEMGRLHYSFQRLRRNADEKEVVQFSLTARGKPESSSVDDIMTWMDRGREWVVKGFADLTSEKAHKLWGRAS